MISNMSARIVLILLIQFAIFVATSASSRSAFVGISTSSSCNKIQGAHNLMHHQLSIGHQYILPRRSRIRSIQYSSTTSLYVKSLRDIIDNDGPPPPKSNSFNTLNNLQQPQNTANSNYTSKPNTSTANTNSNTYKQQLQEAKITKLTHQIKNKSTQEIKKELEHTYRISTTAIRGKENLVKRLVDARLMSMMNNETVKNEKVSCVIFILNAHILYAHPSISSISCM